MNSVHKHLGYKHRLYVLRNGAAFCSTNIWSFLGENCSSKVSFRRKNALKFSPSTACVFAKGDLAKLLTFPIGVAFSNNLRYKLPCSHSYGVISCNLYTVRNVAIKCGPNFVSKTISPRIMTDWAGRWIVSTVPSCGRHKNLGKIKINKQPDEDLSCFILLAATQHSTDGKRK